MVRYYLRSRCGLILACLNDVKIFTTKKVFAIALSYSALSTVVTLIDVSNVNIAADFNGYGVPLAFGLILVDRINRYCCDWSLGKCL